MSTCCITEHAALRYMERTGCGTIERAREQLDRLAARSRPMCGDHRFSCGFILYVRGNAVLTVFRPGECGLRREADPLVKRLWRHKRPKVPREDRTDEGTAGSRKPPPIPWSQDATS